jgi:bacillopeptidase F (M6 metalloprotease family)
MSYSSSGETSEHLKISLNKTIKVYIDRAEVLKQYLEKTQQLPPSKSSVQSQIDLQNSLLMKQTTSTTSSTKVKSYCPSPGMRHFS